MKKQLAATFLVMSLALPAAAQGFDDTSFDSYRPDLARGERLFEVGACASCHLEKGATRNLEAQCAAMGKQFVKTESKKTEALVVASATVAGECIGPDDPRYVSEVDEG